MSRRAVNSQMDAALEAAGVDPDGRLLTPRSFRHTYNAIMRLVLPDEVLRDFNGHRSEKMTDWYYRPEFVLEDGLKRRRESSRFVEAVWGFSGFHCQRD